MNNLQKATSVGKIFYFSSSEHLKDIEELDFNQF